MDKMKESAPNLDLENNLSHNDSSIGYPDLSGKLPESYPKKNPLNRKYVYASGPYSHSINPESKKK